MLQAETEDHYSQSVSEYQQADAYRALREAGKHTTRLPAKTEIFMPSRSDCRVTLSCDRLRCKRR